VNRGIEIEPGNRLDKLGFGDIFRELDKFAVDACLFELSVQCGRRITINFSPLQLPLISCEHRLLRMGQPPERRQSWIVNILESDRSPTINT
jgi:hypothetical protein